MRNSVKDAVVKSCVAVVISSFRAISTHVETYVVAALIPYVVNQLFAYAETESPQKEVVGLNNSELHDVDTLSS